MTYGSYTALVRVSPKIIGIYIAYTVPGPKLGYYLVRNGNPERIRTTIGLASAEIT